MKPPKEKAKELYNKFADHAIYWDHHRDMPPEDDHAKQCALIAVDEILSMISSKEQSTEMWMLHDYWQEVKQEIEKL